MAILLNWELELDADAVLRGQGADPAAIRQRRPQLAELAEKALADGMKMIRPQVLVERLAVKSLEHQKLNLEGGASLSGEFLAQHLAPAEELVVVVCTIGREIEARTGDVMGDDVLYGLALYGVGSAAVEALANAACRQVEIEAAGRGLETTIPLSPGMIGWPVEEGQAQIFKLVDASHIGIELFPGGMMQPLKSLSMVIGLGREIGAQGRTCDYCAMRETCRYQDHYEASLQI